MSTSKTRHRAVAVVIRTNPVSEKVETLLIKRSNYGQQYWTFPGGGIEDGETHEVACLRELFEESSVKGKIFRSLGTIQSMSIQQRTKGDILINEVFIVDHISGVPKLREDSSERRKELKGAEGGNQSYVPQWIAIDKFGSLADIYPTPVYNAVHQYIFVY